MREFISYRGEYNYTKFNAGGMEFTLVGTEVGETNSPLDCMDTFKSSKGAFSERKRSEMMLAFSRGQIEIIESSEVRISVGSSKPKKGRA